MNDNSDEMTILIGQLAAVQHKKTDQMASASDWRRSEFLSLWIGPDLELIVIQEAGSGEDWHWTCRGWRTPDEIDGADKKGWIRCLTRREAEASAIKFYMEKDE